MLQHTRDKLRSLGDPRLSSESPSLQENEIMQFKKGISFKQTGKHRINEIPELKHGVFRPPLHIYVTNFSAHSSIFYLKPVQMTE